MYRSDDVDKLDGGQFRRKAHDEFDPRGKELLRQMMEEFGLETTVFEKERFSEGDASVNTGDRASHLYPLWSPEPVTGWVVAEVAMRGVTGGSPWSDYIPKLGYRVFFQPNFSVLFRNLNTPALFGVGINQSECEAGAFLFSDAKKAPRRLFFSPARNGYDVRAELDLNLTLFMYRKNKANLWRPHLHGECCHLAELPEYFPAFRLSDSVKALSRLFFPHISLEGL
jgi:hypothetical protein